MQNTFKAGYRNFMLGSSIPDPATVGKTFMTAPWVFAEAYKYRRLRECFSISKYWKEYDVFFRQKVRSALSARISRISTVRTSAIPFHAPRRRYLSSLCGSRKLTSCLLRRTNNRPQRRSVSCSTNSRKVRLRACISKPSSLTHLLRQSVSGVTLPTFHCSST